MFGSGMLLGIVFSNAATIITGLLIIMLGSILFNLVTSAFIDAANTLCRIQRRAV